MDYRYESHFEKKGPEDMRTTSAEKEYDVLVQVKRKIPIYKELEASPNYRSSTPALKQELIDCVRVNNGFETVTFASASAVSTAQRAQSPPVVANGAGHLVSIVMSRNPTEIHPNYSMNFQDKDWIAHQLPKQEEITVPYEHRPDSEVEIHPNISHLVPIPKCQQSVDAIDCLKRMHTIHSQTEPCLFDETAVKK
ncbi:hypothetical protein QR680_000580 [Steinernema hermaphroditum]|uniref:Uncharacterized protein n=1 Tax=Steinernema hermaphroditum TaxID=289476 RepID=A0AA39GV34_9BILA|nr:hypothetical protein QR680_000580 [Steinernema hermaphroditum]